MKFIDEAKISVKAGDGGDGCISFRREKWVPRGGPNGGNGARGGHVIFRADNGLFTLMDFRYKRHFEAKRGEHGRGKDQHGACGPDIVIAVPPGTLIKDEDGTLLVDLDTHGQEAIIARGGNGGLGNAAFATSTNRTPVKAERGRPGERKIILLELRLIADVGLIGLPNAGKSTLISKMTGAKPLIAAYPFTTKTPVLGVSTFDDLTRFTIADLPGLIEGAHEGAGLGFKFLKHVERTKTLLHLVDISSTESDPWKNYQLIRNELKLYDAQLATKEELIVLTKIDQVASEKELAKRVRDFKKGLTASQKKRVLAISAQTSVGLDLLTEALRVQLTGERNKGTHAPS